MGEGVEAFLRRGGVEDDLNQAQKGVVFDDEFEARCCHRVILHLYTLSLGERTEVRVPAAEEPSPSTSPARVARGRGNDSTILLENLPFILRGLRTNGGAVETSGYFPFMSLVEAFLKFFSRIILRVLTRQRLRVDLERF
jgi:hypothetical protein